MFLTYLKSKKLRKEKDQPVDLWDVHLLHYPRLKKQTG